MDERIERSVAEVEAANHDLLEFLDSLTDEQWRATGLTEGWPVSAVAYHIADGFRIHMLWLEHLRLKEAVPGTPEQLNESNARTARDAVALSQETVRRAVETGGRLLRAYLRGIGSEEVGRSASHGPLGGDDMTVQDMLEIAPRHVREHLDSMRSVVSQLGGFGT